MTEPVSTPSTPSVTVGQASARKAWATPALARIDGGDAELGSNPVNPEGLALGS